MYESISLTKTNKKIVITSYTNPDLDGTACAIAYAEYLQKNGKNAIAAFFGKPHKEAEFVFNTFNIEQPKNAEDLLNENDEVILVDASDITGIHKKINPKSVIEIIDHRKINQADKFPNAKVQIELVGSCATLIAEKFFEDKINISNDVAVLLYSAIISNTVNFQANVTTERDKKMCDWLLSNLTLPADYTYQMFAAKSIFDKPLKEVFEDDFASFKFNSKHIGIAQLEIVDTDGFISKSKDEVQEALTKIKKEKSLDIIFLTLIDVEKAKNTFVVFDDLSRKLIEKTLHVNFKNDIANKEGIIMRKSIVPLIKEVLERN